MMPFGAGAMLLMAVYVIGIVAVLAWATIFVVQRSRRSRPKPDEMTPPPDP